MVSIDTTRFKSLESLHLWEGNYNHNDVAAIARSIRRFGMNAALRIWVGDVVLAGNHTLLALRLIRDDGPNPELDRHYPPENIQVIKGQWHVAYIDVSHLSEVDAKAFAIADNALTKQATTDDALLAHYLQEIAETDEQSFLATGYNEASFQALLDDLVSESVDPDSEEDDAKPTSDGSLLALTHVTIDDPRHQVERGDVWELGKHLLICADVLTGWAQWLPFLKGEDVVFAPYPGPYIPLTEKANHLRFVMVQPDCYVAGHILDRYVEIKGVGSVQKRA